MLTLHIGTNWAREGGSFDQPAVTCFFYYFFCSRGRGRRGRGVGKKEAYREWLWKL